jgi:hypothetical protein
LSLSLTVSIQRMLGVYPGGRVRKLDITGYIYLFHCKPCYAYEYWWFTALS